MIIDSHHHFWRYNPVEYDWLNEDMKILRRDFLPSDLKNEIDNAGVNGVISVQARQTIEETNRLLEFAGENDFIKGVVGWLPIQKSDFESYLDLYCDNHKLCALRHVIQDEPDPGFILRKEFNKGIAQLKHYGLAYDILIYEHQLPNTISFVDQHPDQVFILDHIAKPRIKENLLNPWRKNIKELARRENVYCKLSGMTTEADIKYWNENQLQPYIDIVLEAFSPSRILFGSDWPVCLLATTYLEWLNILQKALKELSGNEQNQIFSENAVNVYQIKI